MVIRTAIDIEAPVATVWDILIDFESYEAWNPLTRRIEGVAVVDEVVKLHVDLGGKRLVRNHVISRVDEREALCWTIRTKKPWLMRGERSQTLEDLGGGRCRYCNEERVDGLASYIVALTYQGKIRRGIESVGRALKERAEKTCVQK
jgi:hypothetical protein